MLIRPRLLAITIALLAIASLIPAAEHVKAATSSTTLAAFTYEPCLACGILGYPTFFSANWSGSSSGKIVSYTWNFGDGSQSETDTTPDAFHDFAFGVKSNVTLTITDSLGFTDTLTQLFIWNIVPRFNYTPLNPAVGEPTVFNATSSKAYLVNPSPITGYNWNFGDGNAGSGNITKHTYTAQGLYRTSLTLMASGNPVGNGNGNPTVSKTIQVGPPFPPSHLLVSKVFDGLNVTVFGSVLVNTTARTVTGQATVTVTNATTGAVLFAKTFQIDILFRQSPTIRFILVAGVQPFRLGVSCVIDTISNTTKCVVSRNPDVDNDGAVDISDVGMLITRYGSNQGSPTYLPELDLGDKGSIDITDVGIMVVNFGVAIYR